MSMLDEKDPRIVAVEFSGSLEDIGAAAAKAMPARDRYRYKRKITYTLEDGTRMDSTVNGLTKPKLQENFEREERAIAGGAYHAIIRNGLLIGYRQTISLR